MPISINNSLPFVQYPLGKSKENNDNITRMLVDIGSAMNSNNAYYYLWLMLQCPCTVAAYLQFGEGVECDIV